MLLKILSYVPWSLTAGRLISIRTVNPTFGDAASDAASMADIGACVDSLAIGGAVSAFFCFCGHWVFLLLWASESVFRAILRDQKIAPAPETYVLAFFQPSLTFDQIGENR